MSERVAVYGGSFDPPHVAHLLAAAWVVSAADVDRIVLVPTFAHALGKEPGADFEHRLAMCARIADVVPACTVSDVERSLPQPSRTLHTLEALRARDPESTYRLVVGADIATQTHRWHRWDAIVALAAPLWLGREGYERPVGAVLDFPRVSSTEIRARLARGEVPTGLVPNAILAYIAVHGLYRPAEGAP
jgi:nicotinate-nucleotide adenylyltransferase